MNCQEALELMQRYLDRDLAETEEATLQAHLRSCPECADLFERHLLLNGELASLPKVFPPYSIVDSIMPKLEEMGVFTAPEGEPETAAPGTAKPDAGEVVPLPGRKKKGLFSWKIASGVAAAGIILGMLFVNQWEGKNRQNAESLLMSSGSQKTDAAVNGVQDQAGPAVEGKGSTSLDIANTADSKGKSLSPSVTPTAPKGSDQPKTSKVPAAVRDPAIAPSGRDKVSPTIGGPIVSAPAVGTFGNAETSKPLPTPGESKATPTAPAPAEGQILTYDSTSSPGNDIRKPAAAPVPGSDSSGILKGFAPDGNVTEKPAGAVASPDGSYTASVKSEGVVITGKDGTTVFTSTLQLNPGETVSLTGWTEDAKLTYQVKGSDGTTADYTIDVKAKSVTKQ